MPVSVTARKMEEKDQVSLMGLPSFEERREGKHSFSIIPVPESGWYEVIAQFLPKEEAVFMCALLNAHEMSHIKPTIHAIIAYVVKKGKEYCRRCGDHF